MIQGPTGFHHEMIAMKEQSISYAAWSWVGWLFVESSWLHRLRNVHFCHHLMTMKGIVSPRMTSHEATVFKQLIFVCWWVESFCCQHHMREAVSTEFTHNRQLRIVGKVELTIWRHRIINISASRNSFLLKEPMLLKRMVRFRLWENTFGSGMVYLFRVLSEPLYYTVFSHSRTGNSYSY